MKRFKVFIEIQDKGEIVQEEEGKDHYEAIEKAIDKTFKDNPKANIRLSGYEEIGSPEHSHNVHVEPVGDTKLHNTKTMNCSCNPKLEKQPNGAWVVIHNAWDKRDHYEENKKSS